MLRPDNTDKTDTLLHYMKGFEPFSKTFQDLVKGSKAWCPFTRAKIDTTHYRAHPTIRSLLNWIDSYMLRCKFLDANSYTIESMLEILNALSNPEQLEYSKEFQNKLKELQHHINFITPDLTQKLSRLSCSEMIRLDESLVCFKNHCYHAGVTMAVSAVENRIIELIKRTDRRLYLSTFEKMTLGQLIQVFDGGQYTDKKYAKVKRLLPTKHKPLVMLLNQYRIFSAHPKEESISRQISESILHLSFAFMLDPKTCPYKKNELKCA